MKDSTSKAGISLHLYRWNGSKLIDLSLNFEAMILVVFSCTLMIIGLAHSCNSPVAQGRVISYEAKTPIEHTQEMSVVPVLQIAKKTEPAAPAAPSFSDSPEAQRAGTYIKRFEGVSVTEMEKFGIPASISMAQAILESTSGTSEMAKELNNHFGMKCHLQNCKKGHCSNYADDSHKDFFRNYSNAWESWRAHSLLLNNSNRYKPLKAHGMDYKAWAYGLKKAGYATDARYAEKLISVIEKYQLHRLDSKQLFFQ